MTFRFGTVTVEARQIASDVKFEISDVFGMNRSGVISEAKVEAIPWQILAQRHALCSQILTRRN